MLSPATRFVQLLHLPQHARHAAPRDEGAPLDQAAAETLAHVAHELKQPLSAVLAAFQVIRRSKPSRTRERAVDVVDRQLHRLGRLIDDLMEATRVQVHRPCLDLSEIDLRVVTRDVVDAVAPEAAAKRQRLSISLPRDAVVVDADSVRMQQVISNLVTNAIKYTGVGGLVQVALDNHKVDAVLRVTDTGQGIARELLPRVFDAFVQGDPNGHGLGLGLAVAHRYVTLHGGSISAQSAGPARGSTFVVTLPLSARARSSSLSVHATPRPVKR